MAAVDIGAQNGPPVPADDLDDLFDYDIGDVFRDVDTNMDAPAREKPAVNVDGKENGVRLGIDEEIKVVKKRAPIPKLDENRLLSPAGIPKLRRITKERLRFKGKGHEYSDVARLLNVYQLWLDDLYPRAKFADALAMIKKLGHTKRMQTMRKEWIRENKPRENLDATESTTQEADERERTSRPAQNQSPALETPRTPVQTNAIDDDDDELYAATPRPDKNDTNGTPNKTSTDSLFIFDEGEAVEDQPPEDDLDVWLAEDETKQAERADVSSGTNQLRPRMEDNFDDDMEAMAGLDGKGSSGQRIRSEL